MLRLDGECIRGIIDAKYGGSISRLAAALAIEPPPDRSTVTRWLSSDGSHFPRDEERILALAGALDIDPTALWTFDAETFPVLWPKIMRAARTGKWSELLTPLSFLRHFAEPADEWPSEPIAQRFFQRGWVVHEFSHDPQKSANFYQNDVLRTHTPRESSPSFGTLPTATVAYKREWKPFGFVRAKPVTSHSSTTGVSPTKLAASPTKGVQTWFSPGAPPSAVASLQFSLTVKGARRRAHGALRYPGEVLATAEPPIEVKNRAELGWARTGAGCRIATDHHQSPPLGARTGAHWLAVRGVAPLLRSADLLP